MRPDFDRSYLKKQFEFFKTVKSNLKLSKNSIKKDQLVKNMVDPPPSMALTLAKIPVIVFYMPKEFPIPKQYNVTY